jgi:hypothetical protein
MAEPVVGTAIISNELRLLRPAVARSREHVRRTTGLTMGILVVPRSHESGRPVARQCNRVTEEIDGASVAGRELRLLAPGPPITDEHVG